MSKVIHTYESICQYMNNTSINTANSYEHKKVSGRFIEFHAFSTSIHKSSKTCQLQR